MINFDKKEVDKFEAHAEAWWNKEGDLKTLHDINPARLDFIKKYSALDGKKICDVGCGGGILTESLAKTGATLTGIDLSEKAIEIAKAHAKDSDLSINYQTISVEQFAKLHPTSFDIITCMELLEHVPDPHQLIKSCAELVKENGYLFFSTLNRNLKAYLLSIIGAEYILKILPRGTHDYSRFLKPSELANAARAADLKIIATAGMSYHPFTRKCNLTNDMSVNYLVCMVKN